VFENQSREENNFFSDKIKNLHIAHTPTREREREREREQLGISLKRNNLRS
jgi:hypothetical protein